MLVFIGQRGYVIMDIIVKIKNKIRVIKQQISKARDKIEIERERLEGIKRCIHKNMSSWYTNLTSFKELCILEGNKMKIYKNRLLQPTGDIELSPSEIMHIM